MLASSALPRSLPTDVQALQHLVLELDAKLAASQAVLEQQSEQLSGREAEVLHLRTLAEKLKLQIAQLRRERFGRSSEKLDEQIAQLELIVEDLEESASQHESADSQAKPRVQRAPARKPLPEHLPRQTVTLEPEGHTPEQPCACPGCGARNWRHLGEDVSEQLEFVPEHFKVIRTVRPKYSCASCQTIVQGAAPGRPIARGLAGPALLAHVLIGKYCDHLPLYRQSEIYARQGVEIDRSTMADWVGSAASLLAPLTQAIHDHVMAADKLHTDDTPVAVLQPGRKSTKQGRLWTYVRDGTGWHDPTPAAVWFAYSPDRKGEHPRGHLATYRGYIQADAYGGYERIYQERQGTNRPILEVACWAHARRKFYALMESSESPLAKRAVEMIAGLYAVEASVRGKLPEQRQQARQAHSLPILGQIKAWMIETAGKVSRKSEIAKAIDYSLKRWEALARYTGDGKLEIDNNPAEQSIRPIALGRKNWMFAGSDEGGKRAAALYSLIGTAKMHGLNPEAYLAHVLAHINDTKTTRIGDLLPWNLTSLLAADNSV